MPCISGNYKKNVLIPIQVFSEKRESILKTHIFRENSKNSYQALIDTGATNTCISQKIVDDLKLSPLGKISMNAALGVGDVYYYNICIGFFRPIQHLTTGKPELIVNRDSLINLQTPYFNNENQPCDLLLGIDVISRGNFSMSFDSHWSFAY